VDLSEQPYEVNAYIPGDRCYSQEFDLHLAITPLGSYRQQPAPAKTLFLGELDLM